MDLFSDEISEDSLEYARKAVNITKNRNASVLHTLAALYAHFGRCEEAKKMIYDVINLSGNLEPTPDDWLVMGFISKAYGMKDSAINAYKRVKKPKKGEGEHDSSYNLAIRQLKLLGVDIQPEEAKKIVPKETESKEVEPFIKKKSPEKENPIILKSVPESETLKKRRIRN